MPSTEAERRVHVAVGVIRDAQGRILVTRRAEHLHQGGLWEFPGGKCEVGETVVEALVRELQEELAITPTAWQPLIQVVHDYTDKQVLLDVWWVLAFDGEPQARERQPMRWVSVDELALLDFPAANLAIIEAVGSSALIQ